MDGCASNLSELQAGTKLCEFQTMASCDKRSSPLAAPCGTTHDWQLLQESRTLWAKLLFSHWGCPRSSLSVLMCWLRATSVMLILYSYSSASEGIQRLAGTLQEWRALVLGLLSSEIRLCRESLATMQPSLPRRARCASAAVKVGSWSPTLKQRSKPATQLVSPLRCASVPQTRTTWHGPTGTQACRARTGARHDILAHRRSPSQLPRFHLDRAPCQAAKIAERPLLTVHASTHARVHTHAQA